MESFQRRLPGESLHKCVLWPQAGEKSNKHPADNATGCLFTPKGIYRVKIKRRNCKRIPRHVPENHRSGKAGTAGERISRPLLITWSGTAVLTGRRHFAEKILKYGKIRGIITSRRRPQPCRAKLWSAGRTLFPQFGADAPATASLLRSALRSAQKNCGIITSRRKPKPCRVRLWTAGRTLNHSGTVKAVPDQGARHAMHVALWYNKAPELMCGQ